jgi:hypothetical protein
MKTTNWHKTLQFLQADWQSNPLRLALETVNWALNLAIALIFAITIPDVPLLTVYPIFFVALSISIYSAISRGSFGLLITSITLFVIDLVAFVRLLYNS